MKGVLDLPGSTKFGSKKSNTEPELRAKYEGLAIQLPIPEAAVATMLKAVVEA